MADTVEKTETSAAVEKEVQKPVSTEEVDEDDTKRSENGNSKLKENGEKVVDDEEESKDTENGDSTDAHDACPVKRKSTGGGDAPEGTPAEGATPEKKAKLDEKTAESESNGDEAKVSA